MTLPELETQIPLIPWFSRVGETVVRPAAFTLRLLPARPGDDWDSLRTELYEQEPFAEVPHPWDWLPTDLSGPDPIHGDALLQRSMAMGRDAERRAAELRVHQAVLNALRPLPQPHPKFKFGPSDLTGAAWGAATFAVRMAVRELIIDSGGFWCSIIPHYADGHWPCGITHDRTPVVL